MTLLLLTHAPFLISEPVALLHRSGPPGISAKEPLEPAPVPHLLGPPLLRVRPPPSSPAPLATSFSLALSFPRRAVEFIQYLSSQSRVREDIINVKGTGCKCFWTWLQLEGDFSKGQ